jgi:SAM-dependent methyltransferase
MNAVSTTIEHPDAIVHLSALGNGRRRLVVAPRRPGLYVRCPTWDTFYPDDLVRLILDVKGPGYLCDEIMRDEDPDYIQAHVRLTVEAHVDPREFAGQRVLDFGCGAGASTVILNQLLPQSEIVGVELSDENLRIARARAAFHGLRRTTLLVSPAGDCLPESIGRFHAIMLSAVFEHLLPNERQTLLPMLWRLLEPGGLLFLDETPERWFPFETHTSSLPFVNYLPDRLAAPFARAFSPRVAGDATWDSMLRSGIRGGSLSEILSLLPRSEGVAHLLAPERLGISDRVDLWYRGYAEKASGGRGELKRRALPLLRAASKIFRFPFVPYLSVAIRKQFDQNQ